MATTSGGDGERQIADRGGVMLGQWSTTVFKIALALDHLALNSEVRSQRPEDLKSISGLEQGIKRDFDFSYLSVRSNPMNLT